MKKLLFLLSALLVISAFTACTNDEPDQSREWSQSTTTKPEPAGGLTLDNASLIIGVGETKKLTAFDISTNSETLNVLWESSDSAVVAVDISGNVTGVNDGKATVSAKSIDGKYTASCEVTVSSVVSGVVLDKETLAIEVGDNFALNATVLPEGIANNGVTWFSSVETVATVSDKGIVTAVGNGITSIGVKTVDGEFSAFCTVTVTTPVKGITLQDSSVKINKGVTITLQHTVNPIDASDKSVTWSSSDTNVATVLNGKVTAVGAGSATITVTSTNGCTASCIVTVTSAVSGVTVNHSVLTLNVGVSEKLVAMIIPADADVQDVTWSSDNTSVARVDRLTGIVEARASGKAVITVTTDDGGFTASCEVTVIKPITNLTFDKESYTINKGETVTPIVNKIPIDADFEVLTYTCSDETIATVENGVVTGVGHGSVTITATSMYGATASCTVNVIDPAMIRVPVTSITVNKTQISLPEGGKFKLEVKVFPENATDKNISYVISTSSVIKMSGNEIMAISEGVAMITVKAADGISEKILVVVEKLSDSEIDAAIEAYDQAVKKENERHTNALATLKADYDKECDFYNKALAAVNISRDEYLAQKAHIEEETTRIRVLMAEAELNNNQQLVSEYALQLAELSAQMTELEGNYSARLEIESNLAKLQSAYNQSLTVENTLYANNLSKIEYDYQYVQKYIEERENKPEPGPEPEPGEDENQGEEGTEGTEGTGGTEGTEGTQTPDEGTTDPEEGSTPEA